MFTVHQSHQQEILLAHLLASLEQPVSANPLAPEIIVCERGVDRWLWQEIAVRQGIAFNLHLPPPATFIWQTLRGLYPQPETTSGWEPGTLGWRIFECLDSELVQTAAFAPVRGYLADDPGQRKRRQLSERLESLFDQYFVYRHRMVLDWEQGKPCLPGNADEPWQAALWRALAASASGEHRARLLQRFFDDQAAGRLDCASLPARISVFAIPALPPVYLDVLRALGRQRTVDLYLLSPSQGFWQENQTPREQLSALSQAGDYGDRASLYLGEHNPLLANGAARIQQFHLALLEGGELDASVDTAIPPLPAHALGRVQQGILDNTAPHPASLPAFDASVQVHGCYSLLREIEVLHDRLLDAFVRHPDLQPHDILVLTPDIERAAPYVHAVFGAATGAREIPYAIADAPRAAAHPLLGAFRQLLALPDARFTATEVFALLEVPAVARAFGLADDNALATLRRLVAAAGIRWGRDATDRARQGLPAITTHTWEFGLRRLFLGLTLTDDTALVDGWAPVDNVEGSDALLLGKLERCIETLQVCRSTFSRDETAEAWSGHLGWLRKECFKADTPEEQRALELLDDALREFHDETTAARLGVPIPAAVLRIDLEQRLQQSVGANGFLTGAVTFGRLTAARSLPFRMVCLIGMNHDAFPRREAPMAFDLVAASPRPGDRSRRDDDRHLFLETLLSTRDCFYLSYTDRSLRDSSRLEPSVVVSELVETLLDLHCPRDASLKARTEARQTLIVQHPMHAFSVRQYDGQHPQLFSHDRDWLPVARAADASREPPAPFCATPLPALAPAAEIGLADLKRCLGNPARWFLQQRLGLYLEPGDADLLEDDEPFALADDFGVNDAWLARALAADDVDQAARDFVCELQARGALPEGRFGQIDWAERRAEFAALVDRLRSDTSYAPKAVMAKLADGRQIVGTVAAVAATQCRVVTSRRQSYARLLLDAWVDQLVLTVATGVAHATRVETTGTPESLAPLPPDEANRQLASLVALYDRSFSEPLRLFPKSALEYVQKHKPDKPDAGLKAALAKWRPDRFREADTRFPSESEDRHFELCFGHEANPLQAPTFAELAERVFGPLVAHHGGNIAQEEA